MASPTTRREPADDGATAVEYALLLAGIAAVIIATVALLGTAVAGWYARANF